MSREQAVHAFQGFLNTEFVKKHFNWKMILCQHPMYLLVDEDRGEPVIFERTLPAGAPDASTYVERIVRNLSSLDKFDDLVLNYEFSAVEMETFARDFPQAFGKLKQAFDSGRVDFLNGTYSQPHLQLFHSESNWRQFEMGLEVYERLFGMRVTIYACQETGLHQQLVQLLRAFEYKYEVLPFFPWAMEITEGTMELVGDFRGTDQVNGDEFVEGVSLDGSALPVYAKAIDAYNDRSDLPGCINFETVVEHFDKDLYSGTPLWSWFPDMVETSDKVYHEIRQLFDFALFRDELPKRLDACPPRSKAKVYTYWSYAEGVWAEENLRKNKEAEVMALLAEAVYCMGVMKGVRVDSQEAIRELWRTILKYQHHDIFWPEVTDLKRKAIVKLDETIDAARRLMGDVSKQLVSEDDSHVTIFNGSLEPRSAILFCRDGDMPETGSGFQSFGASSFGVVDVPPLGYASFRVRRGSGRPSRGTAMPTRIRGGGYDVELHENGLMRQIGTAAGERLLEGGRYLGGEIKCVIDDRWYDNRDAGVAFFAGEVADILRRTTSLHTIPVTETYYFFKSMPVIKVEIEFAFDNDHIGCFWLDESKANVYYPTTGGDIYYDIPFGYEAGKAGRPLFANNWLYSGGLVYVNRGTVKHWVKDGVIANVMAWGGNLYDNRMHYPRIWKGLSKFDIALSGNQTIRYDIIPFGTFDGRRITQEVDNLVSPVFVVKGKGDESFHNKRYDGTTVTSIYRHENGMMARGFKHPGGQLPGVSDFGIFNLPISEV